MGVKHPVDILVMVMYILGFSFSLYASESSVNAQTSNSIMPTKPCIQILFPLKKAICSKRNLKYVPSHLTHDIRILDLRENDFKTLLNTSFLKYPLVEELSLSSNDIHFIEIATFYPMINLKRLEMDDNKNLRELHSDIFEMSNNLRVLSLINCGLTYFPNDTLRWLPQLRMLILINNRLTFINFNYCPRSGHDFSLYLVYNQFHTLTNETFRFNCECLALALTDNPLQLVDRYVISSLQCELLVVGTFRRSASEYSMQVYKDIFTGFAQSWSQTLFVEFGGNGYFILPDNFFDPLHDKILSSLSLDGPCFTLHPFILRNLTKAYYALHIKNTHLNVIYPQYFDGLSSLRVLDLSSNQIADINPFYDHKRWTLNKLSKLDLSHNNLFELSHRAFIGLDNLSKLDLSDNPQLYFFNATLNSGLSNLRDLDLSRTALRDVGDFYFPNLLLLTFSLSSTTAHETRSIIRPYLFKNALSIQQIVAENSYLTYNDLLDFSLNISIFIGLKNLIFLDMSRNDIRSLPPGLFPYLPSLLELNMSRCRISVIYSGVFSGLKSLKLLDLGLNEIVKLPPEMFTTMMGQLKMLYMHSNRLGYLDDNLFVNTPHLTNLSLANNQLTGFSRSTFIPIQSTLKSIDLSENPFDCSCQLKWLVGWRKSSIVILRAGTTICSPVSATSFRGKSLFAIDPNKLCASNIALYCAPPFAFVGLLGVLSVIYNKRWFIRYKLYLFRVAVFGYEEMHYPQDHTAYEFDLNIMFTDEDRTWATDHLRPNVEDELPNIQRIAFGDNDLLLGMYYLDAVLYVIEHSFKTILLLSRAATLDQEFMMKLRTALNHVTDTQTHSTMLIFLENIPDEEMPHLVKLYLSEERPYMFWVEDEWGQKYFWKQLIKKLKVNVEFDDRIPPE